MNNWLIEYDRFNDNHIYMYLCTSHLKLVRGFKKGVTADSTQGTLVCTAEYQGAGTSLSIFAPVSGNFTGFYTYTE